MNNRGPIAIGEKKRQQGFTLVEMLVSITLFAIIIGMLFSGLQSGLRVSEKAEQHIEEFSRLRIVQTFLQKQLRSALPLAIEEDQRNGKILLQGGYQLIHFVGQMPGYLGRGGAYVQQLEVKTNKQQGGVDLVFSFQSRRTLQSAYESLENPQKIVLLSNLKHASVDYLAWNSELASVEWLDIWEARDKMPLLIRVTMEFFDTKYASWPPLVIAPVIDTIERN